MHEITIDKTRIEFNTLTDNRDTLASPLGDKRVDSVVLCRISNGICKANISLNNRPKTRSFYPNGSITLDNYLKHSGALFSIEREFNRLKGLIYQQTRKRLAAKGISCQTDTSGLHLPNGGNLFGTGTLNYYICNEYKWPKLFEKTDVIDLLCYEVAICAICIGLFYDMINLVVMDNKTSAGNVMFDKFGSYLGLDVDIARLRFRDDALSEDLFRSIGEVIRLTCEADASLKGKNRCP